MNKLIQQGTLLGVLPTQWNTRVTIDVPGPERAKKYFGEFEWDVPENVMDINDVNDIPVGTELLLEGYVRLSQGKDKGDGRPPFVFKNLVASKLTILDGSAPGTNGSSAFASFDAQRAQDVDSDWGGSELSAGNVSDFGDMPDVPF